jgi:hypothetical protein
LFVIGSLLCNIQRTRALATHFLHPTMTMLWELSTVCGYVIVLLLISGLAGDGLLRFQWLWLAGFALLTRSFSESFASGLAESPDFDDGTEHE